MNDECATCGHTLLWSEGEPVEPPGRLCQDCENEHADFRDDGGCRCRGEAVETTCDRFTAFAERESAERVFPSTNDRWRGQ